MDATLAPAIASLVLALAFGARLVAPAVVRAIDAASAFVRSVRVSVTITREAPVQEDSSHEVE